jgi:hypothetical protein
MHFITACLQLVTADSSTMMVFEVVYPFFLFSFYFILFYLFIFYRVLHLKFEPHEVVMKIAQVAKWRESGGCKREFQSPTVW